MNFDVFGSANGTIYRSVKNKSNGDLEKVWFRSLCEGIKHTFVFTFCTPNN